MPSPFASDPADAFSRFGEARLLDLLDAWLGRDIRLLSPFDRRDDAAVLEPLVPPGARQIEAADSLVYGIHFDDTATPAQAAQKLLRRNLSDFAAMGARPSTALLTLFLAPEVSVAWLERFFVALGEDARRFEVVVAGGDVSSALAGTFAASLFLSGHAERPVPRGRTRSGESIWVTGSLGGSLRGRHLEFTPRLQEGRWLAERGDVSSMIDVSDGLASDLPKLLGPQRAAKLTPERLPISENARASSRETGRTSLDHACSDGEDYELAFTLVATTPPADFEEAWRARFQTPLAHIGEVVDAGEGTPCLLDAAGAPLPVGPGYQHG